MCPGSFYVKVSGNFASEFFGLGVSAVLVGDHAAVHHVAEMPFQDAHGFFLRVTPGAGTFVYRAGLGLASELGYRHSVQDCVDAAVAAPG
jgi:hypothetical protein